MATCVVQYRYGSYQGSEPVDERDLVEAVTEIVQRWQKSTSGVLRFNLEIRVQPQPQ